MFSIIRNSTTGDLAPKSGTNLTFNSSSGALTATSFAGDGSNLTGIDSGLSSDSDGNTIGGTNAGDSITTGTNNTTIGKDAGTAITTGSSNVAVGSFALDANTTGDLNVAIGLQAQTVSTTAGENTSVGAAAGRYIGAGQYNTAINCFT